MISTLHPSLSNIHALAISSADDGDNDGLNDWAEFSLQVLGFDYTSNQDELVASLLNNAPAAGLFTRSELLGVQSSTVLVGTSETTADLVISLESSEDLSTYTPIPLLPENFRIDEDGKIRYTLDSSVSSQFFRAGLEGN